MPSFRTITVPLKEAPVVENRLRADGYRERPVATTSTLQPREYVKRESGSNPRAFGGPVIVTFEIRD